MKRKRFEDFVKLADERECQIEGILVLEHGRELFEHRWVFDRERNIYSHTKSFMSTVVGMAIDDGVLSLGDKPTEIFPDQVPKGGNPGLERITLKHLLTMASGIEGPLLMSKGRRQGEGFPDYLSYIMSQPVKEEPGSSFLYSNGDSILAERMLEERLGVNVMQYMYERLLRPMEIPFPIWECCPMGHPLGAGGMFLKLKDMAKLGQLYLDGGRWKGRRLVSEAWVKAAGSKQIENPTPEWVKESADYVESPWHGIGYGYQFWMCPYKDSYRADGAFGQVTVILPGLDMVVAVQCPENGDFQKVQQLLHETILQML